ncbi:hypothetical protein D918_04002 [Trichuris suis]|nr:hypothetical protein D918_04002 [Trichuris suis]
MPNNNANGCFIRIGDLVDERYRIGKMLGAGGFGIVFSCYDSWALQPVAIKFENTMRSASVAQEIKIMLAGSSCSHIVNALDYGIWNGRTYVVMEHLGPDLSRDVASQVGKVYSPLKIAYFGRQMIEAVMQLHSIGYMHNDLKPSNFALGKPPVGTTDMLYLFDFGLARTAEQGFGRYDRIVGTLNYASIGAHVRYVSDPWNDIQSLLYTLILLATGSLPWMNISDEDEVFQKKLNLKIRDVVSEQYEALIKMGAYLESSDFVGTPDYHALISYFDDDVRRLLNEGPQWPGTYRRT